MLAGAGVTALYTFRLVWLVFYGKARSHLHAHDAQPAMRVSLGLLSIGTLLTWLLAGPFGKLLEESLPFHEVEAVSTLGMVEEVLTAPATLLALAVVAAGLAAFWWRDRLAKISAPLDIVGRWAAADFGFEWVNRQVVNVTRRSADALRTAQTGELSWNMAGIASALVLILAILVWWA
jgi:NADH-quinone oxidoreductase subunit L